MHTYELNLPYRISIDQVESYMQKGITEFVAKEQLTANDQSKRLELCEKYFYHAYTCNNPQEFEYWKISDNIIKRIGALRLIQHLADNKIISYTKANELVNNVDELIKHDNFNSCLIHNMALREVNQQ